MKKKMFLVSLLLILSCILVIFNTSKSSNDGNLVQLDVSSSTYFLQNNEEVKLTLSLNLGNEIKNNINVIKGHIEYDQNIFKKLAITDFETIYPWSNIKYNEITNDFIIINLANNENKQNIINITFKVKEKIENISKTDIILKNIKSANTSAKEDLNILFTDSNDQKIITLAKEEITIPTTTSKTTTSTTTKKNEVIVIPPTTNTTKKTTSLTSKTTSDVITIPKKSTTTESTTSQSETSNSNKTTTIKDEDTTTTSTKKEEKKNNIIIYFILVLIIFLIIIILINKKKNISTFILLVLLVPAFLSNALALDIMGDLNKDGYLNLSDIQELEEILISEKTDSLYNNIADINEDNKLSIIDLALLINMYLDKTEKSDTYLIELDKFDIKNDGNTYENNAIGITNAINYAKDEGYKRVLFPEGTYTIKAPTPIIIDTSDLIIDLNNATIKMQDEQHEDQWLLVQFNESSKNVTFMNGTLKGNRFSPEFDYSNKNNEWTSLLHVSGENIIIDNVDFQEAPGYGMSSSVGSPNLNRYAFHKKSFELGSIDDKGNLIDSDEYSRTEIVDMERFNGNFEIGYTLGYQAYPYLKVRNYESYFYDENMNFITKTSNQQFIKAAIPQNAKYARFVFKQTEFEEPVTSIASITNVQGARNIKITNCTFERNATLAMAMGGYNLVIENNKFIDNGVEIDGNKARNPAAAIDLEDGWELMQHITIRNNIFEGNRVDIISCAGSDLIVEDNYIANGIYIYGRTTNYVIRNNTLKGNGISIAHYEATYGGEVYNNTYENYRVRYLEGTWNSGPIDEELTSQSVFNEKFYDTEIRNNLALKESEETERSPIIRDSYISNKDSNSLKNLYGTYDHCTFENYRGYNVANIINSKIINTTFQSKYDASFRNCEIENTSILTQSPETITIEACKIHNSKVNINTWADDLKLDILNSEINIDEDDLYFVSLSLGKAREINITNNTITSKTSPIYISDTTYTTPKGETTIKDNIFNIPEDKYVISGKKISSGSYKINYENNKLELGNIIDSIYENSSYMTLNIK